MKQHKGNRKRKSSRRPPKHDRIVRVQPASNPDLVAVVPAMAAQPTGDAPLAGLAATMTLDAARPETEPFAELVYPVRSIGDKRTDETGRWIMMAVSIGAFACVVAAFLFPMPWRLAFGIAAVGGLIVLAARIIRSLRDLSLK